MWDRIPLTPAQGTLPAPVLRLATGPGGRGGGSFLAVAGCLPAPAGCPWLSRCLRGARLPAARVFPALARPHRCWGACRGPLQPGASSARSGTETTMPRAEAALERGGDQQPRRSAPSQSGGGVHVLAERSVPALRAPVARPQPLSPGCNSTDSLQGKLCPSRPTGLQRWKTSARRELRGIEG